MILAELKLLTLDYFQLYTSHPKALSDFLVDVLEMSSLPTEDTIIYKGFGIKFHLTERNCKRMTSDFEFNLLVEDNAVLDEISNRVQFHEYRHSEFSCAPQLSDDKNSLEIFDPDGRKWHFRVRNSNIIP